MKVDPQITFNVSTSIYGLRERMSLETKAGGTLAAVCLLGPSSAPEGSGSSPFHQQER